MKQEKLGCRPLDKQILFETSLSSFATGVLDDMRDRFRENECFDDAVQSATAYYPHNVYGVATEREISVLVKDLPVYRALFLRNELNSENEEVLGN